MASISKTSEILNEFFRQLEVNLRLIQEVWVSATKPDCSRMVLLFHQILRQIKKFLGKFDENTNLLHVIISKHTISKTYLRFASIKKMSFT